MATAPDPPVFLVKGNEPTVLADGLRELVDRLVGSGDRGLMVEELGADQYEREDGTYDVTPVVYAAQTPPFLTDGRVVVARHAGAFSTGESVGPLVDYLAAPLDTTALVLVWEKAPKQQKLAAVPKKLMTAIRSVQGAEIDTSPPGKAGDRRNWVDEQVASSHVKLAADARKLLAERVGEDLARIQGVLRTLESTFGPGSKLAAADIEPYLGEAGSVAPWDLTDAIDQGDRARAIDLLHRLQGAGERHALGIMYSLHGHYQAMLALDGADVTSDKEAGEILGVHPFRAKKAMQQGRKLGSEGIAEAISLLAQADLDLRGAKAWPDELVMEVLVARLASRARARR